MHQQQEQQDSHVVLNVGGTRYYTSVQTLRNKAGTFFDAYFSGRYAMDRMADGSIFIDRDGACFGHVLDYLRDGRVSVAEEGAEASVSLLRTLKREFGFYCIELVEAPREVAYAVGGRDANNQFLSSVER